VGLIAISFMRALSLVLRLIGNLCLYLGVLLQQVYDIPLFVPLWLEERLNKEPGEERLLGRAGQ
jgi:hypothetical protein